VHNFCKKGPYRAEVATSEEISAFDALSNTEHFVTFSGTTGLALTWDVSQSRGQALSSTHSGALKNARSGSFGFGLNVGRRRLETTDKGVPGYAFPTSGRVLAVSKKLLEVTPESLEERRRKLEDSTEEFTDQAHRKLPEDNIQFHDNPAWGHAGAPGAAGVVKRAQGVPEPSTNPCGRRLDGTEMTDEERRRLGLGFCAKYDGGTASSFSVSLGRAANKESEHEHAVGISLKDGNAQDVFAVKISQDTVYGTPIFTTMGGSSSCVGETATTRRDSRVTIKEIKPLCSKNDPAAQGPICASKFDCECTDLAPGEDAIFSVVLQNLSPWKTSVRYLLRAVNGGSTPWDSGKYARDFTDPSKVGCEDGNLGSLAIKTVDLVNLRNGNGITVAPLNYGQHEVQIRVSRPDFAPQCFSFKDLELELVSVCEDTDWDSNQDVYQYQVHMNPDNGAVSVIHPKFVGRPVGLTCSAQDPVIALDADCKDEDSAGTDCPAAGIVDLEAQGIVASIGANLVTTPASRYNGDGKWC